MTPTPGSHRVLIIAHHFPPSTVAATFRPLRLARYLPELGHRVWVLTVAPRSYSSDRFDPRLMEEIPPCVKVTRVPNPNPLRAYEKARRRREAAVSHPAQDSGSISGGRPGMAQRLRTFLAELAKFPDQDGAWIAMALLPAICLVLRNRIDLIVTSGPPFGAQVLGLMLNKLVRRPWIVQYGNAWTGNPSVSWDFPVFQRLAERLDRRILADADAIAVIDDLLVECVRQMGRERNVYLQANGYDPAHYSPTELPGGIFTVTYTGSLYNMHDPAVIYEALDIVQRERPEVRSDMRIVFAGPSASHKMSRGAPPDLEFTGPLPHAQLVDTMNASHLLLDFLTTGGETNRYSISCKIYEYMAARRPVLAVAPECMLSRHVRQLEMGRVVPPDDPAAVARALINFHSEYRAGTLRMPDNPGIAAYSAPVQAREFMRIADSVCFGGGPNRASGSDVRQDAGEPTTSYLSGRAK